MGLKKRFSKKRKVFKEHVKELTEEECFECSEDHTLQEVRYLGRASVQNV